MFRLSREVRFAVDPLGPPGRPVEGHNGFAGKPPVTGLGQCFYTLGVTLRGQTDPGTGYLTNIKTIDDAVRERVIPAIQRAIQRAIQSGPRGGGDVVLQSFRLLRDAFGDLVLDSVELHLTPLTGLQTTPTTADLLEKGQTPMILLHHTFDFAASHRLHNPELSDEQNRRLFGKCNNPHGHGHNYTLRVTLRGEPDEHGFVMDFYELERIVDEAVIEPFDHKHLNVEVPEFTDLNPSVENIAKVIYHKLAAPLKRAGGTLDAVTVWETPKTWCEYREGE